MKKILLINTEYKKFGGEDANIIDELKFLEQNHKVRYLKFSNKSRIGFPHFVSFFTNSNYISNRKIKNEISNFNPDFVYIHNTWFDANLGIFKILKKINIPVLLKVHNFRFECARYFFSSRHIGINNEVCNKCSMKKSKNKIFNKYFKDSYFKSLFLILYSKRYFKILINEKIKILCLTDFQKRYMHNLGINKDKIFVLHNPSKNLKSKGNKYNEDSDYVVYAGRIDDSKGVKDLISSWSSVGSKKLTLKIIGEGEDLIEIRKQYKNNNIDFLGYLSNEETLKIISNSRAVITGTKMYEGQPRLLCEASMHGVPSIYPSFGGMDEFFPDSYELSFEQYNYDDLQEKIKMLHDTELLINKSKEVYEYSESKLSFVNLHSKLEEIINQY